jgi:drug/metabolite transporter (DMT)-like permease
MNRVFIFIALAIGCGVAYKLCHKQVLGKVSPYAYALVVNIVGCILFLPFALQAVSLPKQVLPWILIISGGAAWTILGLMAFYSYKNTPLSLRDPLSQSRIIFGMILAIVLLHETVTAMRIWGTLTIFFGICLLLWHPERKFGDLKDPGLRWTLGTAVVGAFVAILDKATLNYFPPIFYGMFVYGIETVLLGCVLHTKGKEMKTLFKTSGWMALLGAILVAVGNYFQWKAYSLADISLVYPLLQLGVLFTVISGFLFLGEREHRLQRIIATCIIIAGAVIIKL